MKAMVRILGLLLLIPVGAVAEPQGGAPRVWHTVAYGSHPRQILDIWPAGTEAPAPVVIYLHGGGFRAGDKAAIARFSLLDDLHAGGTTLVSMNYRFVQQAPLAAILQDGAFAVQFLQQEAQTWNLDPNRMAMVGTSAGAGIALWTAFSHAAANPAPGKPSVARLRCAVAINPQAGFDPLTWFRVMGVPPDGVLPDFFQYLHGPPKSLEQLLQAKDLPRLSLLDRITPDDPPVFLLNTYADRPPRTTGEYQHHPDHVYAIATRCRQQGVSCTLSVQAQGHNDPDQHILQFLQQHLVRP